jgi:rod shape-determining protein MreD
MTYFYYTGIGLGLIILQTSVLPHLPFIGYFFDLLLPLVIFLAAFRPLNESLTFTLFLGLLADNLSGGPFGLYLTVYVWLFIGVRMAATVVRAENPFLLVLIILIGVVLQNLTFYGVLAVFGPGPPLAGAALRVVSEQIGWVLLTGPVLAALMRQAHRHMTRRTKRAEAGSDAASG